ncbi:MAG: Glu/Leu/Phe/Val dehydrogenase [Chlamydiae bacterium]|nr:Glu/Leu/Phe/Val dehydrogenase [Chlamydiota bacterium]
MGSQVLEPPVTKKAAADGLQFEKLNVDGYEQVLKVTHKKVGLNALIAIHNTVLGPALGGTRIYPYASFNEALDDVLRLSKGMTHKSAVSEVGFGGGKSVIIADPKTQKTPELLLAFAEAVEKLGGTYICAQDSGCTNEDVQTLRKGTKYVVGLPHEKGSGDPSPFTAWGVFRGVQATLKKLFGSDSLEGKTIAVQGLGEVGSRLVESLFWAGANLILSDLNSAKVEHFVRRFGAKAVSTEQILRVECDVLAPCALGGILRDQTIPELRCKAVAGAANNQLHRDSHAIALRDRGILYAPDFVINAGGLLNVSAEIEETIYNPTASRYRVHHIYDTLLAIYEIAEKNQESTHQAALALANYRIKYGIGKRMVPPTFHH